jgi:tubulin epsilon
VLIDSEEGVLSHVLRSKLGELFSGGHFIKDNSGAGNNWAVGYNEYGPKHHEALLDEFHSAAEKCDSLQSFFMMHSLGGGTGSGLGSYVLEMLADHFPSAYRFTASVFPQEDDDVVTSPYNSILALEKLIEHAHCVLPFDNQALIRISEEVHRAGGGSSVLKGGTHTKRASFDPLNNIVAHALTNLTASMRFDGLLNVDINEITTNLVPFPRLHFLLSSLAPMVHTSTSTAASSGTMASAAVDPLFTAAIKQSNQLLCCDLRSGSTLAAAALVRGSVPLSDVSRNMVRLRPSLRMVSWNPDGFKLGAPHPQLPQQIIHQQLPQQFMPLNRSKHILKLQLGLCDKPPVAMPCSLMLITNNTAVRSVFPSASSFEPPRCFLTCDCIGF